MLSVSENTLNRTYLSDGRRGVLPRLVHEQIRNTADFLFDQPEFLASPCGEILQRDPEQSCDFLEYFQLLYAAHFSTVATFVPTDFDVHIRHKLWFAALDEKDAPELIHALASFALDARSWDSKQVSERWVRDTKTGHVLSGHDGEWLTIAVPAYAACLRKNVVLKDAIYDAVVGEVVRESELVASLFRSRDGIGFLKAAALWAHNSGDLDRVIDLWALPTEDPLRKAVYKVGQITKPLFASVAKELEAAAMIYKRDLARENHRHYPLRKLKFLRRSRAHLLGLGPFFDAWGTKLGRDLSARELGLLVDELATYWLRCFETDPSDAPVGYARAVKGMSETVRGGLEKVLGEAPARTRRMVTSGGFRRLLDQEYGAFEARWAALPFKVAESL